MNTAPLAEHLRQVTPARSVAGHPQNRIHEQPVVDTAAPPRPGSPRQMTFDPFPLLVRQRASAQGQAPSPALNQNLQTIEIPKCRQHLGGTTPGGEAIEGTFELLPRDEISKADLARADFTIKVLGLNREVIRVARANAFGGFRARMVEYVQKLEAGAADNVLRALQKDLLATPHLTVFDEIRRQRTLLPEMNDLLNRAPAMMSWDVVPATEDAGE